MPFDRRLIDADPKKFASFTKIPRDVWNQWKIDYDDRINAFETSHPGGSYHRISLKFDFRSIFFEKATIVSLYSQADVSDGDFVVFKFISKKGNGNSDLRITPCIMEKGSYLVKVNSNKMGHKTKGGTDDNIPASYSSGNYEERLIKLRLLDGFKDDVQGIAHTVGEFKQWFLLSPSMVEFAVIFMVDDSKFFDRLSNQTRKMNIGFINADTIPTDKIILSQTIDSDLYDQGSICCPPA